MLPIERRIIPKNFNRKNNTGRIKYIVIHYFGSLGTARAVANYFFTTANESSAHYVVDDTDIIQCVEDGDVAWHCGAKTYVHPYCRNTNSIGIEVKPYKLDKTTANSATPSDWYFSEETTKNTIDLVKYLMEKYNIPLNNVIRHYDVMGKWCPRPFMGDDVNKYYGISGNEMWKQFKNRLVYQPEVVQIVTPPEPIVVNVPEIIKEEEEIMTGEQIYLALKAYTESLSTDEYAVESSKRAVARGAFMDDNKDGLIDNPQGFLLRQELAIILNRLNLI